MTSPLVAVPEVLSEVLSYLEVDDLINMEATSHSMLDLIRAKRSLQQTMFFIATPESSEPGKEEQEEANSCTTTTPHLTLHPITRPSGRVHITLRRLPDCVGRRRRKMLIANPPIRSMSMEARMSQPSANQSVAFIRRIENEQGITVGDLLAAAEKGFGSVVSEWSEKFGYASAWGAERRVEFRSGLEEVEDMVS